MADPVTVNMVEFAWNALRVAIGAVIAVCVWLVKDTKDKTEYVKKAQLESIVNEHREDMSSLAKEHRQQIESLISLHRTQSESMWRDIKAEFATKEHVDGGLRLAALQMKEQSRLIDRLDTDIRHLLRTMNVTPSPDSYSSHRRRVTDEDTPSEGS